ncbi:hypothetical protein [Mycobacterium sp. shizuoka-1]|uniref:hypothetical protein n=1 Tax=Mycobacterium sp. shizuoka-1 TaxID=2039281 RepID=UPI0018EDD183|nr:hypothetical protein [Mycobacterium sp. shizuoka-1]
MATRDMGTRNGRLAARCAAVTSIGAAVIHFVVVPMHWHDWKPSGVFFASIAVFQLVWGFLVWLRPNTLALVVGVTGNAGAVALWVLSRTAGVPFGPNAGQPEDVEAAGICVLLLQCYVIMGAMWSLRRRGRAHEVSGRVGALVLLGANAVMVGAVTVGLASSLQGNHHHGGAAEAEAGPEAAHHPVVHGHHQHAEPVAPPAAAVAESVPEASSIPAVPSPEGRPVTDMGLIPEGHQHDHGD